ncbi:type II toxin-antitoxin system HigB family toxin [Niabella hirudinis]|uniref:type II toxin-antitoxin system HigB family toxin n=1 Tax=Niabella hirudinis TaxID=1285929 RepID=UPI003EC0ABC0
MKITNKDKLEAFVSKHKDAINPVNKWVDIIEDNNFTGHNDIKQLFPAADYVGNQRYVFNIKGNRYRFVVLVVFVNGYMRIKFCGTHAQYDKIKDIQTI